MRKSFVQNIKKVNDTFYGTLRANIMSKNEYNALVGSKKATKMFGYNQMQNNASNPNFIDPRRLVGNMPQGKTKKRNRRTASIESENEISAI